MTANLWPRAPTLRTALMLWSAIASGGSAMPSTTLRVPDVRVGTRFESSLRTTMVRRYTMSGYIRPLLFWLGRDDIGWARVVWRHGDNGARGYELLVGTDPVRAPRALNRWGYIAEEVLGAGGSVLALMTRADESSYEEAAGTATRGQAAGEFRAIRSRVADGSAIWQIARVHTPQPLTIHDLDAALDRVGRETDATARREMQYPRDVRPGFLSALAEMLDRAPQMAHDDAGRVDRPHARLRYLFAGQVYEMRLRRAHWSVESFQNRATRTIRATFDIYTLATNTRTRFEIACGTEGLLAGVPVSVEWQPRWWLRVRLKLVD